MKKLFIACIALVSLYSACKKDDPAPNPPAPVPNVVASCSFEVDSQLVNGDTISGQAYQNYSSTFQTLSLSIGRDTIIGVGITIQVGAVQGGEYRIKANNATVSDSVDAGFHSQNGSGGAFDCHIYPANTGKFQDGYVKITKLDLTNKRVSGEFYFDACNNGTVYKIRNGKFTDLALYVQ